MKIKKMPVCKCISLFLVDLNVNKIKRMHLYCKILSIQMTRDVNTLYAILKYCDGKLKKTLKRHKFEKKMKAIRFSHHLCRAKRVHIFLKNVLLVTDFKFYALVHLSLMMMLPQDVPIIKHKLSKLECPFLYQYIFVFFLFRIFIFFCSTKISIFK